VSAELLPFSDSLTDDLIAESTQVSVCCGALCCNQSTGSNSPPSPQPWPLLSRNQIPGAPSEATKLASQLDVALAVQDEVSSKGAAAAAAAAESTSPQAASGSDKELGGVVEEAKTKAVEVC
jgi:hypothetical protein